MNNLRVHGLKILSRRTDVIQQSDYHKYENDLRLDFQNICGYCGKHEMISHKGMEPDHFVPYRIDSSRECDYTNLVYSCFTCNRKKLGKWPTENKHLSNDGLVGFVDPTSKEFDEHLSRDANGTITFNTSVGQYMYKTAFKFDIRPTKEVWQASQLFEKMDKLRQKILCASVEEKSEYIEIEHELSILSKYLFTCKE